MKTRRFLPCLACGLVATLFLAAPATATDGATGFASVSALGLNGTTGGTGGPIVVVDSEAELKSYLQGSTPRIIAVQGSIFIDDFGDELSVGSNKTILGLDDDAEIVYGGLNITNQSNVIIRNLTIRDSYVEGDWDGKTQDYDGIQVDDSHHIWIDHVHIKHMGDGLIDLRKGGLDYITVSNSILSDHNKAFGVGWTDETDQHVTVDHNWIHDTNQRNPAFDNVIGHFYNNLLEDISSYGLNPRGDALVVSENNIFDGVNRPYNVNDNAQLRVSGDVFINSPNASSPRGDAFDPSTFYSYSLDDVATLRESIMANAGPQAWVGVPPLAGDFDGNGEVDGADFLLWQRNPDVGVLADWQGHLGNTALASTDVVPEPTSIYMLVMGLSSVFGRSLLGGIGLHGSCHQLRQ